MPTMIARVATTSGAKYVAQLCKHWSHKFDVVLDGKTGIVPFPDATAKMVPDETGIDLSITGEDRETVERLTDVLARHIDRFAFREAPLNYEWNWHEDA